jgi:hypothetical protein
MSLRHKTRGSEFDSGRIVANFQVTFFFFWAKSIALGFTQPLTEISTKESPWG